MSSAVNADSAPTANMHPHQVLATQLLKAIADGTYSVGDRLPTEYELCTVHGLARGTVRRALERLEQLGMIERRPGAGTTVLTARPVDSYQPIANSTDDIAALAATTRLIRPETLVGIALDTRLARRLGAPVRSRWHVIRGVRIRRGVDQPPVCWSEHYLRGDLPASALKKRFTGSEIADLPVEQTIKAELLDALVAKSLSAEEGGPALVVTRRMSDTAGRLLSVGVHVHPADRYQIVTEISPTR